MSTIDFSDFDRSIEELNESIDASKGNPDKASQKLEAFLKDNQEFFAAHKQDAHVKEKIESLAGRVQQLFPGNNRATRWAKYLQALPGSGQKILESKDFTSRVDSLKSMISAAQEKQISQDLST